MSNEPTLSREQLINQYETGFERLRAALDEVPEEARKWRPAPGKWSVHEVICHCADSEGNAAIRLRYLTAEKDPLILGYDQDEWTRQFDYHSLPLEPSLAVTSAVRAWTTILLRQLPEAAWGKVGKHTEAGRYTTGDWLRIYAEHLEVHTRQIRRVFAAWKERPEG